MITHFLGGLSVCIPASVPTLGRPPSLLPGFCRFSVCRLSIGTMGALRLPLFLPRRLGSTSPRVPELTTLFSFFTSSVAVGLHEIQDVVSRFRPNPGFVIWRIAGLPCFMVSLVVVCPALRPRPRLGSSLLSVLWFRPRHFDNEGQRQVIRFRGSITRLSTSLSTLHAALSTDDARLAYGALATRFPAGLEPAWGTLRRFSPCSSFLASAF